MQIEPKQPIYNISNNQITENTPKKIWDYLTKFRYEKNDYHYPPAEVERRGTLDCSDHAFYAYTLLKKNHIPAKVIIVEKPPHLQNDGVPLHALCLYKTPKGWQWMDNVEFGKDINKDWHKLPGKRYKQSVKYYVVDIEETWAKNLPELEVEWKTSIYP